MRQNRTRRSNEGSSVTRDSALHVPRTARETCAKTMARHGCTSGAAGVCFSTRRLQGTTNNEARGIHAIYRRNSSQSASSILSRGLIQTTGIETQTSRHRNVTDQERREDRLKSGMELGKNDPQSSRNVSLTKDFPQPPPLAKPVQHRCAPLQAAPLVQHRQVLILHLQRWRKIESNTTNHHVHPHLTCFAGQSSASMWTWLRPRSMPDAFRRLRTPATVQQGSTATQALMSDAARTRSSFYSDKTHKSAQFERCEPTNTRNTRHEPASSPRGCPMLRDTMSPSRCRQRHTKRLRDLLAAEALGGHSLHGEAFFCATHHVARKILVL